MAGHNREISPPAGINVQQSPKPLHIKGETMKYTLTFWDDEIPKKEILIVDGPIEILDFQLFGSEAMCIAGNLSGRGWHINRPGNDRRFRNLRIEVFVE